MQTFESLENWTSKIGSQATNNDVREFANPLYCATECAKSTGQFLLSILVQMYENRVKTHIELL